MDWGATAVLFQKRVSLFPVLMPDWLDISIIFLTYLLLVRQNLFCNQALIYFWLDLNICHLVLRKCDLFYFQWVVVTANSLIILKFSVIKRLLDHIMAHLSLLQNFVEPLGSTWIVILLRVLFQPLFVGIYYKVKLLLSLNWSKVAFLMKLLGALKPDFILSYLFSDTRL